MADTPAPSSSSGSFGQRMSRKVGPLPVWAWAVIALVVGYYLYKKYQASSASTTPASTPAAAAASTPIPSSDQSGGGFGSASGTSGTTTPTTWPQPTTGPQYPGNGLAGDTTGESTTPAGGAYPIANWVFGPGHLPVIPSTSGATSFKSFSSAGHGL